jgi:hypothetical protein
VYYIFKGRSTVGVNVKGTSSLPLAINTRKEHAKGMEVPRIIQRQCIYSKITNVMYT